MVKEIVIDREASERTPALVEAFGITGLHGYRSISLEAGDAVSIMIAKNGSGKTTLLGVLNAFLKGQYFRLRGLDFETIFCQFHGSPERLVLTKQDVEDALSIPDSGDLAVAASRFAVPPANLFKFVTEEWPALQAASDSPYDNQTYSALAREYGYNRLKIDRAVAELIQVAYEKNENISRISRAVKQALQGKEVLYLPTYRRIELALRDGSRESKYKKRKAIIDASGVGLFTGDIQFGLSDISERLSEMNEKVVHESNRQYRAISADIINGLIDGSFDEHSPSGEDIPAREDLELLFSRVEQSHRYGPHYSVSIPNLDKIYAGNELSSSSGKFLAYFLAQLNKVIASTKQVETRVQEFVNVCNEYLSHEDLSTIVKGAESDYISDGKKLVLNKQNLQVSVASVPEGRRIGLDALSSGEKQMISLFAKLFLYEKQKIVLIDEPELSLSIDWQRKILLDVAKSPLCRQIIAITHSPFVFDNELEPFAGSLRIALTPKEMLPPSEDEEFPFGDEGFDE